MDIKAVQVSIGEGKAHRERLIWILAMLLCTWPSME